jgi:hypothetical protein
MAKRHSGGRPSAMPRNVAIGWYDAVQWARLKQVAIDANDLDDSYEAWKRNAENVERKLRREGTQTQRVQIDVEALVSWCQFQERPVNGKSRSQYAAHLAARRDSMS